MGLINRYILKTHIAPFIFGSSTVMFLFLFQFLLKYIDKFLGKGLSTWVIVQLISLQLAWMLVLAIPMGVLFSTLMSFGAMSSNQEITIIKASGGGLYKMMRPLIIVSIFLTVGLFLFNDYILPESNHKGKMLLVDISKKKPTFSIEKGQFSSQVEGFTILSRNMDSLSGAMKGVTIYDNRTSRFKNIISADSGFVKFDANTSKLVMDLSNGEVIQHLENSVNSLKKIEFKTYNINLEASGFNLERTQDDNDRSDRELSIADMRKIIAEATMRKNSSIKRIDEETQKHFDYITCKNFPKTLNTSVPQGIDEKMRKADACNSAENRLSTLKAIIFSDAQMKREYELQEKKYWVEIHKKYAIPVACFIFVFVGCPLGIKTKGGNFGVSAIITLGFYILYWACLMMGEKLADRAVLSPFLGMWMGNIIVGGFGIILMIKNNNENFNLTRFLKIDKLYYKVRNIFKKEEIIQ
jgi:lipopolysaccharide export system permease protein